MATQGSGVQLEISSEKARSEISGLIEQLSNLEKTVDKFTNIEITLNTKSSTTNIAKLEKQISTLDSNINAKFATSTKKITKAVGTATGKSIGEIRKVGATSEESFKKMAKASSSSTTKVVKDFDAIGKAATVAGKSITLIGDFGGRLNQSITALTNSLLSPVKSVFAATKSLITTTVSEGIDQIEKLELAQVGLRNHFKNDNTFDLDSYVRRIRSTAEKTQGLSAGDLADYIAQLAPLSNGNSTAAFDATMGALKIIKYGGGDTTTDMMSIIKNIRDVQSKGKAYQMDLNQFNRAAPLLATMLQQQGLGQFVKTSSDGVISLNITKENYQGLLNAFAQLNYNEELNDTFNEMSKTLSGLIEQTKQAIQNDVMDLLNYEQEGQKSLIQLWKDALSGDELSSARQQIMVYLRKGAAALSRFIQSLDKKKIIDALFNGLSELASYAKRELLPALKELIGIEGEATPTSVIVGLIKLIVKFGQGMVDGMKTFINWINFGKNALSSFFGMFGDDALLKVFGFFKGFGRVGWDLVLGLGKIVSGISKLLSWGGGLSKLVGGVGGGIGGLGLGLMGIGGGSALLDGLFGQSDGVFGTSDIMNNLLGALGTGVGVAMFTGHPLWGVAVAAVQATAKTVWDIFKNTDALKKKLVDAEGSSLSTVQKQIIETVVDEIAHQENSIYRLGNAASDKAKAELEKWAENNISDTADPTEQAQQQVRAQQYLQERIAYWSGSEKLNELLSQYFGKSTGQTALNSNNANQYTTQLQKLWKYLNDYGYLDDPEKFGDKGDVLTTGADAGLHILDYLTGKGFQIPGSVENLNGLLGDIHLVDEAVSAIIDRKDTELEIEVALREGDTDKITSMLESMMTGSGFKLYDGRWVTQAVIQASLQTTDGKARLSNGKNATEIGRGYDQGLGFNSSQRYRNLSSADKQALQDAWGYNGNDLMGQWAGAQQKINLGNISTEDRAAFDNSLDDTIHRAATIIFNGGDLTEEQERAALEALKQRYGSWNEVLSGPNKLDKEVARVLMYGLKSAIGENTAVLANMMANSVIGDTLLKAPQLGITGSGLDQVTEWVGTQYLDGVNWEWWKQVFRNMASAYFATGGYVGPVARAPKPLFFNWGGMARGVDTVPAMLRPGEFVEKTSAVNKAGLGVMNALNQGDLGQAYRLLGAKLNTNTTNSYDSRRYNTTDSHNTTTNNFRIFNTSRSAVNTSYRGLRNIMALR